MNIKTFLRLNVLLLFFCFSLIAFSSSVYAQSGCCSHHSGVCGCSGGSKLCCDGTLSPSCTCYSPPPPPPTRVPIVFPSTIQATTSWTPNADKTFDVLVTLDDPNPSQYSATLNNCKSCDPGPLSDFNGIVFVFNNVKPGTHYLNVKKEIGGYWTNNVYYTIIIPKWYAPSPTPIPTIRQTPSSTPTSESSDSGMGILSYLGLGALGFGGYKFIVRPIIDANKA